MAVNRGTISSIEQERDFQLHLSIRKRAARKNSVVPRIMEFNELKHKKDMVFPQIL
jgi:hypothetical protein